MAVAASEFSDADFLDQALRGLVASIAAVPRGELPNVIAARLHGEQLVLHLIAAHPSAPPKPWTSDEAGLRWSIFAGENASAMCEAGLSVVAPYPALVTIGTDSNGGTWLLDLEAVGVLSVAGDHERCLDFGRFLAAELAVNAWSEQVTVTAVGLGRDVVQLNPARLQITDGLGEAFDAAASQFDRGETVQEEYEMDVLTARLLDIGDDLLRPRLLLAAMPSLSATRRRISQSPRFVCTHRRARQPKPVRDRPPWRRQRGH